MSNRYNFFRSDPNAFDVNAPVVRNSPMTGDGYPIQFDSEAAVTQSQMPNRFGAIDRTPGMSRTLPAGLSSTIGKFGLGKAGAFGVPYLGAAVGLGLLGKSLGLFGRKRRGPSPYELEEESAARRLSALQESEGGQMYRMGMDMMGSGRAQEERGRAGMISSMMDPAIAQRERAQLLSDLSNMRRGTQYRAGLTGGLGAVAQMNRNLSGYDPTAASGLVGIGANQLQRRAQGYQSMAQFGGQDFSRGLGMRQSGFGMQAQGLSGLQQYAGGRQRRADALAMQRRQQTTQALGGLGQLAGTYFGMGRR